MGQSENLKSVVITGTSTGIGKACLFALLLQGFRIFAGVRDQAVGDKLLQEAPAGTADRLFPLILDVTQSEHIQQAVACVTQVVGSDGLWGLQNNAGIAIGGPIEFITPEKLRWQLEVNVIGQIAVTQAFLPLIRQARGRILFTGSISGDTAGPGVGAYSISKFSLEALCDTLRRELRPWGIEVSLLKPGAISSEIWQKANMEIAHFYKMPPEFHRLYGSLIEAGAYSVARSARLGSPASLVADSAVHAFTASRPKTRYRMGTDSTITKLISYLPDRWADFVIARAMGLR